MIKKEARKIFEEYNPVLDLLFVNDSNLKEEETLVGNQTLKELAVPNLNQQLLCITFPNLMLIPLLN